MIAGQFVRLQDMEQWLGAVEAYYAGLPLEPTASEAVREIRRAVSRCRFCYDGVLYVAGRDILRGDTSI